jgi:hypothetical protein
MRANFIKMLCENEIKSTEMALATENIGNELQSMVEKLTNIKTKDLAELVKKIKFDNDIEAGESFNQSMSEKLDQAIQTLTEIKGSIDNEVVSLFNGEGVSGGEGEDMSDGMDFEDSDMANDFGSDEEVPEFNPDEEKSDEESDDLDLSDIDLGDEVRVEK